MKDIESRWWDRAINALVPAAFVAAMISYAFPTRDLSLAGRPQGAFS